MMGDGAEERRGRGPLGAELDMIVLEDPKDDSDARASG